MMVIIALLLAVLVMLASLYFLARSKKEDWSKVYSVAAYIGLSLGMLFFLGSAAAGVAKAMCHSKGHCAKSCSYGQGNCDMSAQGQSCHRGAWGHGHGMKKGGHSCSMMGQGSSCAMMGHGSSCPMMGEGSACGHHCMKQMHKKMCFDKGSKGKNAKIEIEIEEESTDEVPAE